MPIVRYINTIDIDTETNPQQHNLTLREQDTNAYAGIISFSYSESDNAVTIGSVKCADETNDCLSELVRHMVEYLKTDSLMLSPLVSNNTEIKVAVFSGTPIEDAYSTMGFNGPNSDGFMTTDFGRLNSNRQGGKRKRSSKKRGSKRHNKSGKRKSGRKSRKF
jgi:hypothetical protein